MKNGKSFLNKENYLYKGWDMSRRKGWCRFSLGSYIFVVQMFEEFVLWRELYKVYTICTVDCCLGVLSGFQFSSFNIYFVVFVRYFGFQRSESLVAAELAMFWIKTLYRILYEICFVYACLGTCRWRGLGNMRIFFVRIYCIGTNIFIDISTGFPKFALTCSIDTFIFAVCIFPINIGWEADVVSFVITSSKRL